MLTYCNGNYTFTEFVEKFVLEVLEAHDNNACATVIVADPQLYEDYRIQLRCNDLTVDRVNLMARVEVTLLESWTDLVALVTKYLDFNGSGEQQLETTKVITLYGVFSQFLESGRTNSTRDQMPINVSPCFYVDDFSAKALNRVCCLLFEAHMCRDFEIFFHDCDAGVTNGQDLNSNSSLGIYGNKLWNQMIPNLVSTSASNLQKTRSSSAMTQNGKEHKCDQHSPSVAMGLIFSKWTSIL
ncbi:uncharacterized protein RJT20DRAFT_128212 [Scheffersomyces xylosifermentans]|uniref:uncharacterized protein n=1 Tax=Scheffersomyces xylosifermentans TaxID=1304137 RepID=UPI00315C5FF8